jgi:RecA-family ATPase
MGNKLTKSVSFNTTNKEDEIMLKALKRRNFSGYVKKLIMADIQAKQLAKEEPAPSKVEEVQKPTEVNKEVAESTFEQLKKRQQQGKSLAPKVFRPNN